MINQQIEEAGLSFDGAEEYWAYLGLRDGYYSLLDTPFESIEGAVLSSERMNEKCENSYLFGFFLGVEVKVSNVLEKIKVLDRVHERTTIKQEERLNAN